MQWETDPKSWSRYKQTGGVARRARERMMDESQAERNDDTGETDIMNQNLDDEDDYDYTQHLARKSEHLIDNALNFLKATRESRKNSPARKRKQTAGMTDRSQATSNLMSDADRAAVRAQKRRKVDPKKEVMLLDRQNRGVIPREAMRRNRHAVSEEKKRKAAEAKGQTYVKKPYVSLDERRGKGVILPESDKTFNIREGGRNFTINEGGMKASLNAAKDKASKTRNKLAQREYQAPTSGNCENKTCADGKPPLQNAWQRKFGICGKCMEDEGMHTSQVDYDRDKILHMEEYFGGPEATFTGLNEEQRKKLGGIFADEGRLNFRNQEEKDAYEGQYEDLTQEEIDERNRLQQIKEQEEQKEGKKLYPSLYNDKRMSSFFDRQELERSGRQAAAERAALQQQEENQQNILATGDNKVGVMERDNLRVAGQNPNVNLNYAGLSQDAINTQNAQRAAQQLRAQLLQQWNNLTDEEKQAKLNEIQNQQNQQNEQDEQ